MFCIGCISSDILATRKLCGFLGHTARLGCNKCLKSFPTARFGEKPDFSGFEKTSLESLEAKYGVRY